MSPHSSLALKQANVTGETIYVTAAIAAVLNIPADLLGSGRLRQDSAKSLCISGDSIRLISVFRRCAAVTQ